MCQIDGSSWKALDESPEESKGWTVSNISVVFILVFWCSSHLVVLLQRGHNEFAGLCCFHLNQLHCPLSHNQQTYVLFLNIENVFSDRPSWWQWWRIITAGIVEGLNVWITYIVMSVNDDVITTLPGANSRPFGYFVLCCSAKKHY